MKKEKVCNIVKEFIMVHPIGKKDEVLCDPNSENVIRFYELNTDNIADFKTGMTQNHKGAYCLWLLLNLKNPIKAEPKGKIYAFKLWYGNYDNETLSYRHNDYKALTQFFQQGPIISESPTIRKRNEIPSNFCKDWSHEKKLEVHYDWDLVLNTCWRLHENIVDFYPEIMGLFAPILEPLKLKYNYSRRLNKPIKINAVYESINNNVGRLSTMSDVGAGFNFKYEFSVEIFSAYYDVIPTFVKFALKEFIRLKGNERRDYVLREIVKQLNGGSNEKYVIFQHIQEIYPDFEGAAR